MEGVPDEAGMPVDDGQQVARERGIPPKCVSFCAILCHLIAGGTVGLHLSGGLAGLNLAMKSQKCVRNETAGEWSQTVPSWLAGGDAGLSCKEE